MISSWVFWICARTKNVLANPRTNIAAGDAAGTNFAGDRSQVSLEVKWECCNGVQADMRKHTKVVSSQAEPIAAAEFWIPSRLLLTTRDILASLSSL